MKIKKMDEKTEFEYPFKKLIDNIDIVTMVVTVILCIIGVGASIYYVEEIISWLRKFF